MGPCTRQQHEMDDNVPKLRLARAEDETVESPYCVGQRIVMTPARGPAELGTVRYVGPEQGGILGIELDSAGGMGNCNGRDRMSGEQHFMCLDGKGIYLKEESIHVQAVPAPSPSSVSAIGKLSLVLEIMQEYDTLRQLHVGKQVQSALSSGAGGPAWVTAFRKIWDRNRGCYFYNARAGPLGKGLSIPPRGARVLPAEGGPDEMRESGGVDSGVKMPDIQLNKTAEIEVNDEKLPPVLHDEETATLLPDDLPVHVKGLDKEEFPQGLPDSCGTTVTPEEGKVIFDYCFHNRQGRLPCSLILMLVRTARQVFLEEPTVRKLSILPAEKVTVIGDLHGHLKDLVHIWHRDGLPSSFMRYLFNGNVCSGGDSRPRSGQEALKMWACILSFKLIYPDSIYVNRGNHEDHDYSIQYGKGGLQGEISACYRSQDADALITAFKDLFEVLPLATVIDEHILVLHGGLPRNCQGAGAVTLEEVSRIQRPLQLRLQSKKRVDQLATDILWSDPHDAQGIGPNPRGSSVISFGPDVTADFLVDNGLRLLIRSHQVPQGQFEGRGIEWWHPCNESFPNRPDPVAPTQEGLCLTVFSASDFCGHYNSNSAGTVIFEGSAESLSFSEHSGLWADMTLMGQQPSTAKQNELHALGRASVSNELIAVVLKQRHKLLQEFSARDPSLSGFVSIADFLECCRRIIPSISWEDVLMENPHIVPAASGRMCYTRFLSRYKLCLNSRRGRHAKLEQQFSGKLYGWCMIADRAVRQTLRASGDGAVPANEFLHALAENGCLFPSSQVNLMFRSLTSVQSTVQVDEFLGRVAIDFPMKRAKQKRGDQITVPAHLDALFRDILFEMSGGVPAVAREKVPVLLRRFFERNDLNGSGALNAAALTESLRPLPSAAGLSESQLLAVAKYVGADTGGGISYPELLGGMEVVHKGGGNRAPGGRVERPSLASLLEDVVESVCIILVFHYGVRTIRRLLLQATPPGSSRCSSDVFKSVLLAMSAGPFDVNLSTQQVDCLVASLDLGPNKDFDFEEYLSGFEIMDTQTEHPAKWA